MKMAIKTGNDLERKHHDQKIFKLDNLIYEESKKIGAGEKGVQTIDQMLRSVGLVPELKLIQVIPKVTAEQDSSNPAFTVEQ